MRPRPQRLGHAGRAGRGVLHVVARHPSRHRARALCPWYEMTDANISGTALPAFDRIRAGDVEYTIRSLLEHNRGEVATLETQPDPTFANTVLPLEQLSHRLSRTWSPIS